jgi:hypothetical protein
VIEVRTLAHYLLSANFPSLILCSSSLSSFSSASWLQALFCGSFERSLLYDASSSASALRLFTWPCYSCSGLTFDGT